MKALFIRFGPLLLASMLFSVFGCEDKDADRIILSGTVYDQLQKIPLAGAEVLLTGKVIQGGTFNPDPSTIAVAFTDANGSFSINTGQLKASDLVLKVVKENYFTLSKELTSNDLSAGKPYQADQYLDPVGWIRLRVQNVNPGDATDLITYRILSDNPACSDCCNSTYVQGEGPHYDQKSVCRTKAGTTATVIWNIHKWNFSTSDTTILNIPLFDTIAYKITY
jgi:hypothetical protein